MYDNLKKDHHLRHDARLQLGLFLKGIGLNLEDSISFWKTEFLKGMTLEVFEKKYVYNIKHSYGQLGSKTDYSPKSCINLITERSPGCMKFLAKN
jgi:DNA primase large subunit